jgi:hypothetical protein
MPGARVNSVAFVEDQFKVTPSPRWINVCDACNVTVGRAGAGGAGGGAAGGGATACFRQAPANKIKTTKLSSANFERLRMQILRTD